MDRTQLKREDFSFEANDKGYMLKYKGQSIGGAGRFRPVFKPKRAEEYAQWAEFDIRNIITGKPGHYQKLIEEINDESK